MHLNLYYTLHTTHNFPVYSASSVALPPFTNFNINMNVVLLVRMSVYSLVLVGVSVLIVTEWKELC